MVEGDGERERDGGERGRGEMGERGEGGEW